MPPLIGLPTFVGSFRESSRGSFRRDSVAERVAASASPPELRTTESTGVGQSLTPFMPQQPALLPHGHRETSESMAQQLCGKMPQPVALAETSRSVRTGGMGGARDRTS